MALWGLSANPLHATTLPTTIALTVSPSTVTAQKPVTLTATVMASGTPATPGQVVFCVAMATFCEDLNILGTAQVTSNGTATIKVLLGLGSHDIYAKFLGTTKYAGSTSLPTVQTVEVTGHMPSTATVSTSGGPGNYTLTSTVASLGTIPPAGTLSFNDFSTLNTVAFASLDSATLASGFTPSVIFTANSYEFQPNPAPAAPAVADLNGDGYPDVMTTNPPSSVSVQLGDPAHPGRLLAPTIYPAGQYPVAVTTGDFNQDGTPDLVVLNQNDSSVSVLFGDPTHPGQFLPQQKSFVGEAPGSVAVGDFNGDGLPDIVVANYIGAYSMTLLLNNPEVPGQFLPPVYFAPQQEYGGTAFAVGDFNGDGLPDLALANSFLNTGIMVLLNNPASPGQFLPPTSYGTGTPYNVVVADFNGDGIPDLVVGSEVLSIEAQVLLGDPAHPGQFLPPTGASHVFVTGNLLTTGDFNGDGILDLATTDPYAGNLNGVAVFFGDPVHRGQFLPKLDFGDRPLGIAGDGYLAVADLNGDGISDLVVPGLDYLGLSREVRVLLGTLTETATASPVKVASPSFVYAAYPGDEHYLSSYSCDISFPASSRPASPVISRVTLSNVTATSATVNWTTNVPTYGGVDWSTVTSHDQTGLFNRQTAWINELSTTHSFVIGSFSAGYQYTYEAWSVSYFNGCDHWTSFSPEGYVPVVPAD